MPEEISLAKPPQTKLEQVKTPKEILTLQQIIDAINDNEVTPLMIEFDAIRKEIKKDLGVTIPQELALNLSFDTHQWQKGKHPSLLGPVVYWGGAGNCKIEDSLGTIIIFPDEWIFSKKNVKISDIAVSGVDKTSKHALTARYLGRLPFNPYHIEISISTDEFSLKHPTDIPTGLNLHAMPTFIRNVNSYWGIITPKMLEIIGIKEARSLIIEDQRHVGGKIDFTDPALAEKIGYALGSTGSQIIIRHLKDPTRPSLHIPAGLQ